MICRKAKRSVFMVATIGSLSACVYFQPEVYRVSIQAREPSEVFLRNNACLGMSIQEFRDKIRNPRTETKRAERIFILRENEDSFEIGTNGKVGLRASFRNGRFVGSSYWFVEVAGSWSRTSDSAYVPCFKDENGKLLDISFTTHAENSPRLRGIRGVTKRVLSTAYIGEHQILNWDDSVYRDYKAGPDLAADTRVRIYEEFNNQVYPITVENVPGHKVLYVPREEKLENLIDFKAGFRVPQFVE